MKVTRWLSSTLWVWTRSLRRTPAIANAQRALKRAALRRHTQGQYKAKQSMRQLRIDGLRKEIGGSR